MTPGNRVTRHLQPGKRRTEGSAADRFDVMGIAAAGDSTPEYMPRLGLIISLLLAAVASATAQVNLTGISYTQDFNSLGSGLPAGWSVHTSAAAGALGNV